MSTTADTPSSSKKAQEEDIDKILNREASAFQREVEVDRIFKAFKLKYAHLVRILLDSDPRFLK